MNDEFKFRVWRNGDGDFEREPLIDSTGKVFENMGIWEYDPTIIEDGVTEFSTGRRDCKRTDEHPEGQLVYAGDIVKTDCSLGNAIVRIGVCEDMTINEGEQSIDYHGVYLDYIYPGCAPFQTDIGFRYLTDDHKVIGNIHENPELWEEAV